MLRPCPAPGTRLPRRQRRSSCRRARLSRGWAQASSPPWRRPVARFSSATGCCARRATRSTASSCTTSARRTGAHYPEGDVYDKESASQCYFHAHPRAERLDEAGHFHTFLRAPGMPSGALPVACGPAASADSLSHLVAIAVDHDGYPISLFTVNRWVTGDAWYRADDVCRMVERFEIDQARPSWVLNRWITAMLRLFWPLVLDLVRERDLVVAEWAREHDGDVFEDRGLETPSVAHISLARQIAALRKLEP